MDIHVHKRLDQFLPGLLLQEKRINHCVSDMILRPLSRVTRTRFTQQLSKALQLFLAPGHTSFEEIVMCFVVAEAGVREYLVELDEDGEVVAGISLWWPRCCVLWTCRSRCGTVCLGFCRAT